MAEYQVARVAASKDTWQEFRQVALLRGLSVASYLGRLVDAELHRRRGRAIDAIATETEPQDAAVAALEDVRAAIDELEDIAGRLARSAVAYGGAWSDVAASLRIPEAQARRVYESPPS